MWCVNGECNKCFELSVDCKGGIEMQVIQNSVIDSMAEPPLHNKK